MGLYEPDLATVWSDPRIPTLPANGIALYLFLVSKAWSHGPLPDEDDLIFANARAIMDRAEFDLVWAAVRDMFEDTKPAGKLVLPWLEGLRECRHAHLLARAGGARKPSRAPARKKPVKAATPAPVVEPPAPEPAPAEPDPSVPVRIHRALVWWKGAFEEQLRVVYVAPAGDHAILKRLLAGVSNDEFKRRALSVLAPATRPKWITGNPTLSLLERCFNDVRPVPRVKAAGPARPDAAVVERMWTDKHRVLIEVAGPSGATIHAPGLDAVFPGYDAACRELKLNGFAALTSAASHAQPAGRFAGQ